MIASDFTTHSNKTNLIDIKEKEIIVCPRIK